MQDLTDRYLIGYARVSTEEQEMRMQIDALLNFGVPRNKIVTEKKSGAKLAKRKLRHVLDAMRPGDALVVWRIDRLGRSLSELIAIVKHIEDVGANLISLTEQIDTRSAMGKFFFHLVAALSEFERNIISERTKAGVAAAKAAGKRIGPPSLIADCKDRVDRLKALDEAGVLRDDAGNFIMSDIPLMLELNKVEGAKEIKNVATVRRWRNNGAAGLDPLPVDT